MLCSSLFPPSAPHHDSHSLSQGLFAQVHPPSPLRMCSHVRCTCRFTIRRCPDRYTGTHVGSMTLTNGTLEGPTGHTGHARLACLNTHKNAYSHIHSHYLSSPSVTCTHTDAHKKSAWLLRSCRLASFCECPCCSSQLLQYFSHFQLHSAPQVRHVEEKWRQ